MQNLLNFQPSKWHYWLTYKVCYHLGKIVIIHDENKPLRSMLINVVSMVEKILIYLIFFEELYFCPCRELFPGQHYRSARKQCWTLRFFKFCIVFWGGYYRNIMPLVCTRIFQILLNRQNAYKAIVIFNCPTSFFAQRTLDNSVALLISGWKKVAKDINIYLNWFCQNTQLLWCFCLTQVQNLLFNFFLWNDSEKFFFSNCFCRTDK